MRSTLYAILRAWSWAAAAVRGPAAMARRFLRGLAFGALARVLRAVGL